MNAHSAPPGDWQPPEPPWLKEARELVASANRIADKIGVDVDRHVRAVKRGLLFWMIGSLVGYWIGFGSVELLKWWAGLK